MTQDTDHERKSTLNRIELEMNSIIAYSSLKTDILSTHLSKRVRTHGIINHTSQIINVIETHSLTQTHNRKPRLKQSIHNPRIPHRQSILPPTFLALSIQQSIFPPRKSANNRIPDQIQRIPKRRPRIIGKRIAMMMFLALATPVSVFVGGGGVGGAVGMRV